MKSFGTAVATMWGLGLAVVVLFWINVVVFLMWLFDKIPAMNMTLVWWLGGVAVLFVISLIAFIITGVKEASDN